MNKFMDKYFKETLLSGSKKLGNYNYAYVADYKYGKLKDGGYGFVFCIDVGGDNIGTIIPTDKNIAFTDKYKDYLNYALKLIHKMLWYTFYKGSDREYLIHRTDSIYLNGSDYNVT